MRTKTEVAKALRGCGYWIMEDCKDLCDIAGMSDEWEAADGDTFESVVEKAAKKLRVKIY